MRDDFGVKKEEFRQRKLSEKRALKNQPWLFRHWFGAYVIWTTWRYSRTNGGSFTRALPIVHKLLKERGFIK